MTCRYCLKDIEDKSYKTAKKKNYHWNCWYRLEKVQGRNKWRVNNPYRG